MKGQISIYTFVYKLSFFDSFASSPADFKGLVL